MLKIMGQLPLVKSEIERLLIGKLLCPHTIARGNNIHKTILLTVNWLTYLANY